MMRPTQLEVRCGECLLYGAIQGLADGLILVDNDERIFHANRRARELLDLGTRHVTGTRLRGSLQHIGLASFWSSALEESVPVTSELPFPSGVTIRATVSLCLSASGDTIGRALLLRDVSREKKLQIELTTSVAERLVELTGLPESEGALALLTARERDVLRLVTEGLTNAQIADRLHVSSNTIASHLKNLFPKLGVSSRAQAAALAATRGLRPLAR
ncbi:MAG TPA: LuxR C-terminal-related transcriptional regulator [Candidatus Polarisedimenticolia bacterium]|nr:LuxR C-terminal-related transcriptional regulator [Candidatus Polarisedimenticolia bacterium]